MEASNSTEATGSAASLSRGRGRGRGGVGKYLRARGRRGPVLRAEWGKRDNGDEDDADSEEERMQRAKYSRREMTSNADRYIEPEPDPHGTRKFLTSPSLSRER